MRSPFRPPCLRLLLLVALGGVARAQELPEKGGTGEAPEDPTLFANPPIVLTDGGQRTNAAQSLVPVVVEPVTVVAPRPSLAELQQANVQRLQTQVAALRKRAQSEPSAREMLISAESALRSALQLASVAEGLRQRSAQAEENARKVRLPAATASPPRLLQVEGAGKPAVAEKPGS